MRIKKMWLVIMLCLMTQVTYAEVTWPDGQFVSQYTSVKGSKIHYVDYGTGDPILLVHGIPTWSYLWRNMIIPLSKSGRVIAVDMIGYGKSEKPNLEYKLTDLQDYLEGFIRKLNLRNIRLVVHDLGGPVALTVAANNRERFKGIIAFETIFGPIESYDSLNDFQKSLDDKRGIVGPGGQGYELIMRQNIFINGAINELLAGSPQEVRDAYAYPFKDPLDRIALYRPFQDIPVDGRPKKTKKILKKMLKFLRRSSMPKLYIYPQPGFTTAMPEGSPNMAQSFKNVELRAFGPGLHFLQEENSERLSSMINDWLEENE